MGPGAAEEDVVLLGIAEDEDVVFPPVILPLVVLPPVVVLFPDVAFCANVDIVVKFSAAYYTRGHYGYYNQASKFESFLHRVLYRKYFIYRLVLRYL